MDVNLFEELKNKKTQLKELTEQACLYGWIDHTRKQEITQKIDNDILTIGVIGQMKCGKSTFLNSFVFEDDVLPAATTPMTAALSIITYGENKKIVAEFYTSDEWEEQKLQAARSLEDVEGNEIEQSKIKAAKELVDKSKKLGSSLSSFLGKTQEDCFDNLEQYVGADGKYISITKAVRIYYPKEYLRGVEIVDTPGFNDPIVSREERTKAFLNKADVVLLMLYAGRPFDSTDRRILFKNVKQCGIGKVIIGINKYDIPYENGETEEEIQEYVKKELSKASRTCDDTTLVDLLKDTTPIPLSAEMALLSEIPMSKITASEAYQHAWNRNCDNFEISSQPQMREKSHIDNLINAVKYLVEKQKNEILFAKPLNAILASGNKQKDGINDELREVNDSIQNLSIPDDELDEKQENLSKAIRRMRRKISSFEDDLEYKFNEVMRKGRNTMEDDVDDACGKMVRCIENWGTFQSISVVTRNLDDITQNLVTRTLKRTVEKLKKDTVSGLNSCLNNFFSEAEDVLRRFVPDLDSKDVIQEIRRAIDFDIDRDLFRFDQDGDGDGDEIGLGDYIYDFFNGFSFGTLEILNRLFSHADQAAKLRDFVATIKNDFDPSDFISTIEEKREFIINKINDKFIEELLKPMETSIIQIKESVESKGKQLNDVQERKIVLIAKREKLLEQLKSIEKIVESF